MQACLRYVFAAVVVSCAVQLVLLPLMIVYFHRLSLASLILNIVVGVLLAVVAAVALLALVIAQFSDAIAAPLITFTNTINWSMIHSVDPFMHFDLASIRVPEYSGWGALVYVLYYIPLLTLRRRGLLYAVAQVSLVFVLVLHPFSAGVGEGKLRIDFLDVGQGDAALLTMPDRRTLLVDGGGATNPSQNKTDRRSIGEAVVSEYLWWGGLDTVDYVLPTHADTDHIDGLNDVVRNFTVHGALVARAPANDPEFAKFSETLAVTGTQVVRIQAGDLLRFGEVEIEVLWPRAEVGEFSRNNDSTVLRVGFLRHSILLTGDIEKGGERALVAEGRDLRTDLVKVPHHGSKSSSTALFVEATKARVAVISVGKNSLFGHPHREVVERWEASGAQVLTTGECGTITVVTDGTELTVTGMQSHTSQGSPCRVHP
jgi:competence protein ComEC